MRTKIINLVGSPSSGKSLIAALLFAELKMMHKRAEYVQEYAKTLVWQNRLDELANQYNVTTEQYKMIKSVNGKVEYICLDSPLLLGIYYNRYHPDNVSNVEKTEKMILDKIKEFDNIYIFIERNKEFPYEIEGRIHNEKESDDISIKLMEILKEFKIPYKSFRSDKSNIKEMIEYIKAF
jgi:nicotinamide riboside kinase